MTTFSQVTRYSNKVASLRADRFVWVYINQGEDGFQVWGFDNFVSPYRHELLEKRPTLESAMDLLRLLQSQPDKTAQLIKEYAEYSQQWDGCDSHC